MQAIASRIVLTARALALLALLAVSACVDLGQPGTAQGSLGDTSALQLKLADATLSAGAPGVALHVLDERLRQDPHDTAALVRRGHVLAELDRPVDAAESFSNALKLQPDSTDALTGLANARSAAGDAEAAESAWRRALAVAPDDSRIQIGLAISLDLQAKHREAQTLYRAVLARMPDDSVAGADLGLSLVVSGHVAIGLPLLRRASQSGFGADHPGANACARHNLAVGLVMAGDEPAARRVLSQDLSPEDVNAALIGLRQFAAAR